MTLGISRRDVLVYGASGAAALAFAGTAHANEMDDLANAFIGDGKVSEGKLTVSAPEIAENGNSVPIEILVDSAMDGDDFVEEVLVLAAGNPSPGVATFKFGPLAGTAAASTRVRLAKTQDVVAFARMKDGSIHKASRTIKVTIGGCGG